MEFIHEPYQPGDTIAAVTTPPGEGGVAGIRISGQRALEIGAKVFSGPVHSYQSHTAHYGHILNEKGEHVDDVLLMVMKSPRSYTGEDAVEISCHGGSIISRRVLETVLKAGARAARPGEFTFKAYMNGKMDLSQAEAVQALICAKNERALDAAESQLQGALSQKVSLFQKELTGIAAILEAWVDFPEEGLEFATMDEICAELDNAIMQMKKLDATFHDGKIIHDGISLCLIGCPNVGKSSLMNALLEKDRAIVSPTPGTTRDIVEDHLRLNGLNFKVVDTAGIRNAAESIEQEGIRRSHTAMQAADLILLVLDANKGLQNEDEALIKQVPPKKTIVVWNKSDLPHHSLPGLKYPHVVNVSALNKQGLDTLRNMIDEVIWDGGAPPKEEVMITNVRHHEALKRAIDACETVLKGLQTGTSPEFLAFDLRQGLMELGKIIGTNITEDILTAIFSKFCIGK